MKYTRAALLVGAGFLFFGCKSSTAGGEGSGGATSQPATTEMKMMGPYAIQAKNDSGVEGEVKLEAVEGGVKVWVMVKNAPPGDHGTHIHQTADCSSADGKSAGGHFNPKGVDHGMPGGDAHHLGDLGNLTVGEDGTGTLERVMMGATLDGGEHSFVGRALIFHAKVDDGGQPTGNAGPRLGCAELK